jgi:hypothetical protein
MDCRTVGFLDGTRVASTADDSTRHLWDSTTGEHVEFRVHLIGNGEFASLTPGGEPVIQVSPKTWRDLGWLMPDASGALSRYSAEVFGPPPEHSG